MFSNFILIQAVLYCLSLSNRRGLVPGPPANTKSADAQVPHRQWRRIPLYRGCRIHSPLITCFFKSPALCFWGLSKQIHDALLRSFGLTIPQLVIQVCTLPVYMWKVSMGSFFFFQSFYLLYLFLAALGFHCCAWAFSSCSERGLLFVAVHGLLTAVASIVAEQGLSNCGTWA